MALKTKYARTIRQKLLDEEIFTDARGDILRFGPAPYTTSSQCEQAIEVLFKIIRKK